MEISLLKTLLDGISRFRLLSSSNNVKAELVQRYRQNIDEILELLKPVFDEAVGSEIVSDERLNKVLEELDSVVNEATELVGSWHQMMSKVYFVLQIESVIIRIQTSALGTCWLLDSLSPSPIVNSIFACTKKIQHMLYEQISDVIKEAIKCQIDKVIPASEHLEKISNSLCLSSNQELLTEVVALEKLKAKVSRGENYVEVENIDHMIALVNHMHDCFVKSNQLRSINGVQIPADFCCPLSLELMSDPVIVESGQTYERVFIRKWLDEGFSVCPKTCQTLGHSNLIPNYTVKALIANWCESNDIKQPDPIKSMSVNLPSTFISPTDLSANDCKIPQSGHSQRTNHPRSSQSNRFMINSHKDSFSSNGVHQETFQQDIPKSPNHHSLSIGSILHTANGCGANMAKTSIMGFEKKKESSSEERRVDSGAQISNQSKQSVCQPPEVDEQFQDHNQSVCAVSSSAYPQGAGDANMVSRVSSDLTYYSSNASGEVTQEAPVSSAPQMEPELPSRVTEAQSRSQTIWRSPSESGRAEGCHRRAASSC